MTQPLRVAYVLLRDPAYSETFVTSEIEAVRRKGALVEVFVARPAGNGSARRLLRLIFAGAPRLFRIVRDVRILGVSYGARALLASIEATALADAVRRFQPDVIHTHFVNLPTAVAVLIGRQIDRPVTAVAHAADFLLDRNPTALGRRLRLLSHLFVISNAAAAQIGQRISLRSVEHSVVRASFDGTFMEPIVPDGSPLRMVVVGRLIEKKGIDTAIAAVAELVARGRKVRLDVYGNGPLEQQLRTQVSASSLAMAVELHGRTPHAKAMAALAEADVAVLPCRHAANGDVDGIPVFLMEAASRGIPIVTTAVSGIPELVGSNGGWLVPPDDPSGVAWAVEAIMDDPLGAQARARAVQRRIHEEFSPQLQAERLLERWRTLGESQCRI